MNCNKCKEPCNLKNNMFYFRGRYFTGWVCKPCNALYQNKEDSMFEYAELFTKWFSGSDALHSHLNI